MKFWIGKQHNDSGCYNILASSKKELVEEIMTTDAWWGPEGYVEATQYDTDGMSMFEVIEATQSEGGFDCNFVIVEEYDIIHKNGKCRFTKKG